MRELCPRRVGNEAPGHQPAELRGDVVPDLLRRPRILQLAHRSGVFQQDRAGAACHFVRDQRQAPAAVLDRPREGGGIGGHGIGEEGTVECHVDDLVAQLVRTAVADEQVGDAHLLQVGDVLLEVLQRVA